MILTPDLKGYFRSTGKIFYDLVRILPDVNDHPVGKQGRNYQLRKLIDIVGAEDQIYKRIAFLQLFHHLRLPASYSRTERSSYEGFSFSGCGDSQVFHRLFDWRFPRTVQVL